MKFFERTIHRTKVRIRWARILAGRVARFVTHDMWYLNVDDLSRWKARAVKDIKVVFLMLKVFSDQKIGFQVTALAYQSMMSLVPFIAIGLYLTNGVGIADQFHAFLNTNISNQKLIEDLIAASDKIIATAESGLFGFISMASFLWILIWLMITVRRVFNNGPVLLRFRRVFDGAGLYRPQRPAFLCALEEFPVVGAVRRSVGPDSHGDVQVYPGRPCPDASRLQGGADRGHRLYGRSVSLSGDAGDGGQAKRHLRLSRGPAPVHDLAEPGMDHRPVRGRVVLLLPKCQPFESE